MADISPVNESRLWLRIVVRSVLVLALLLMITGFVYENISEARDRRFHPMPGRLVDVGGYRLHIHCVGNGSVTIVLESGLGDSYISWYKVQPPIAQFARVCSYDRAGIGYSDSSPRPRTSNVMAEELHVLLHNAGITGPIVLVGHSAGGYGVRLYASQYRSEVAGMVLVDASHPDQENRLPLALKNIEASWLRESEFLAFSMPFGVPRILALCDSDPAARAAECNFHTARANLAENRAFPESAAQAAATGLFGDLPLAVLSHDPEKVLTELPADLSKPTNDAWEKMQEELVHLSTRGTQTVARNSSHYIQIDRPDLVVEAVRGIVDQARQIQPVPQVAR